MQSRTDANKWQLYLQRRLVAALHLRFWLCASVSAGLLELLQLMRDAWPGPAPGQPCAAALAGAGRSSADAEGPARKALAVTALGAKLAQTLNPWQRPGGQGPAELWPFGCGVRATSLQCTHSAIAGCHALLVLLARVHLALPGRFQPHETSQQSPMLTESEMGMSPNARTGSKHETVRFNI